MDILNSSTDIMTNFTTPIENSSGHTDGTSHHHPSSVIAMRTSFIILTVFLSLVANTLCLIVLPHTRRNIPENNRLLMMSLSAADLGIGFVTAFSIAPAILDDWPYGNVVCELTSGLNNAFSGISILSLVFISVDRYLAVTKPLRYVSLVTRNKVITAISILWAVELVFCSIVFPFTGAPIAYDQTLAKCTPLWRPGKDTPMLLVTLTLTVLIPFFITIFIYTKLFLIARDQINKIRALRNIGTQDGDRNNEISMSTHSDRKASRTFFVITIVFALSWLPYTLCAFYSNISRQTVHDGLKFFAVWAVVSTSWSDVLVFAGMNSSFRLAAVRLFQKCTKRNDRVVAESHISVISKETYSQGETG